MHIVITGVGRRLGLTLARHFLDQGHQVSGTYRTPYPEVNELRDRGMALASVDMTDLNAVQQWAGSLAGQSSAVDVLIHNASAFQPTKADPREAAQQFAEFFAVHMQAPFLITELLRGALERSQASTANVIHLTDIYADRPSPGTRTYCATKAGLQNLSASYALLLAPRVRVNAIQPGPLAFLPEHTEEAKAAVMAQTPLQKEGGFAPVVQTVEFILANEYLTGANIPVSGGRHLV